MYYNYALHITLYLLCIIYNACFVQNCIICQYIYTYMQMDRIHMSPVRPTENKVSN